MLPNIRSHSPGGKLPDPFRDAIPGPLRRVREPLDDRAAVPSSMGSIVKGTPCALVATEIMPRLSCPCLLCRSWLRNRLRQRDLEDLQAGRPALGKTAFKTRVRATCHSQYARRVAAALVEEDDADNALPTKL